MEGAQISHEWKGEGGREREKVRERGVVPEGGGTAAIYWIQETSDHLYARRKSFGRIRDEILGSLVALVKGGTREGEKRVGSATVKGKAQ